MKVCKIAGFIMLLVFSINCFANVDPKLFEKNEVADMLCKYIDSINVLLIPTGAIMLGVMGLGALNGKFSWTSFAIFGMCLIAARTSGVILDFFVPGVGLKYGCKCKPYHIESYDSDGNPVLKFLNLDENCNEY